MAKINICTMESETSPVCRSSISVQGQEGERKSPQPAAHIHIVTTEDSEIQQRPASSVDTSMQASRTTAGETATQRGDEVESRRRGGRPDEERGDDRK